MEFDTFTYVRRFLCDYMCVFAKLIWLTRTSEVNCTEYASHQGVSDGVFMYRRDGVPAEVLYEGYPGAIVGRVGCDETVECRVLRLVT